MPPGPRRRRHAALRLDARQRSRQRSPQTRFQIGPASSSPPSVVPSLGRFCRPLRLQGASAMSRPSRLSRSLSCRPPRPPLPRVASLRAAARARAQRAPAHHRRQRHHRRHRQAGPVSRRRRRGTRGDLPSGVGSGGDRRRCRQDVDRCRVRQGRRRGPEGPGGRDPAGARGHVHLVPGRGPDPADEGVREAPASPRPSARGTATARSSAARAPARR